MKERKTSGLYLIIDGEFELQKKVTVFEGSYDRRFGLISKMPKTTETLRIMIIGKGQCFGSLE